MLITYLIHKMLYLWNWSWPTTSFPCICPCLQIYYMTLGPLQWQSTQFVLVFYQCYQALPQRFVESEQLPTCHMNSREIIDKDTEMIDLVSFCSNVLQTMTVMWRTVGMGDLLRRRGGGFMTIKRNVWLITKWCVSYLNTLYFRVGF